MISFRGFFTSRFFMIFIWQLGCVPVPPGPYYIVPTWWEPPSLVVGVGKKKVRQTKLINRLSLEGVICMCFTFQLS